MLVISVSAIFACSQLSVIRQSAVVVNTCRITKIKIKLWSNDAIP